MVILPLPRLVLARAAHEGAFDVDVVAAAQLRYSIFAEAVPGNDALNPDGTIELSSSDSANLYPGNLIPDGDGGVLATWTIVLCATAKDSLRENGNRVSPESGVGLRHDVRT